MAARKTIGCFVCIVLPVVFAVWFVKRTADDFYRPHPEWFTPARVERNIRAVLPEAKVIKVYGGNVDGNFYVALCSVIGKTDLLLGKSDEPHTMVLKGKDFRDQVGGLGELRIREVGNQKIVGTFMQTTQDELDQGFPLFNKIWNYATGDAKTPLSEAVRFGG